MSSSYRISLENWLKELDVKADRVLDIGGSQLPIKPRIKSWDVKEYKIADLPSPHKDSPKPDFEGDLNEIVFISEYDARNFDLIFCLEVFDYVWNPANAIKNIANLLSDNGRAYITFPFMYPQHQPIEDDALRYAPGGIKRLADYAGLRIVNMIPRYTETDALEHFIRSERLRAAKHINHNILGWIVEVTK
jgi:SAM-dependent methyltransferase